MAAIRTSTKPRGAAAGRELGAIGGKPARTSTANRAAVSHQAARSTGCSSGVYNHLSAGPSSAVERSKGGVPMDVLGLTVTGELVVAIVGALVTIGGIAIGKQERFDTRLHKLEWSIAYKLGGDDAYKGSKRSGPSPGSSSEFGQTRRTLFQYAPGVLVGVGIVLILIAIIMFNEELNETTLETYKLANTAKEMEEKVDKVHDFDFITVRITARTSDQEELSWWVEPILTAPEGESQSYVLRTSLRCKEGYTAVAAWHELVRTGGDMDAMRYVSAYVDDEGLPRISLRARTGKKGWALVDLIAVCRSVSPAYSP